jgi:hypothetical protein
LQVNVGPTRRFALGPRYQIRKRSPTSGALAQSHDVKSTSLGVHSKSEFRPALLAQNQTGATASVTIPEPLELLGWKE